MDSDSDTDDLLLDLLSNTQKDTNAVLNDSYNHESNSTNVKLHDFNFLIESEKNEIDNGYQFTTETCNKVCHSELGSSDDEDARYFEEQNYSTSGRELKYLLKENELQKSSCNLRNEKKFIVHPTIPLKNTTTSVNKTANVVATDVYSDPFFGLRIINPLISSTEFKNRMAGRSAVTITKLKNHVNVTDLSEDWVIAGVIISHSETKKSQKGNMYCIWKISDLSENMNSVSIFLFSGAYKTHWKTTPGTVIGILNPNILNPKEKNNEITLSVDNGQKIMILGKSKDMGKCKSIKKNGDPCTAIVNINKCEYCVYHVKQEYNKCSKRVELQSMNNAKKFSSDLPGYKNNSLYAKQNPMMGGRPFNPIPAKRNMKLYEKDCERLALLSGTKKITEISKNMKDKNVKKLETVELTTNQLKKDEDKLRKLKTSVVTRDLTSEMLKTESPFILQNCVNKDIFTDSIIPQLGKGCINGMISLSDSIPKQNISKAKMNALKWVQQNGKIQSKNPNEVRDNKNQLMKKTEKRTRESEEEQKTAKRVKNINSEQFKEMMEKKSAHMDLIEEVHENEKEKYFEVLEKKEKMEEKMMTTYKINCKAVRCLNCKYTAFSASDLCKKQNHSIRVFDAVKSFFKCSNCGNRTVSLDRLPSYTCKKCSSSSWVRTAMMDENRININKANLSVRGDEHTFLGADCKNSNINLLVPDTG